MQANSGSAPPQQRETAQIPPTTPTSAGVATGDVRVAENNVVKQGATELPAGVQQTAPPAAAPKPQPAEELQARNVVKAPPLDAQRDVPAALNQSLAGSLNQKTTAQQSEAAASSQQPASAPVPASVITPASVPAPSPAPTTLPPIAPASAPAPAQQTVLQLPEQMRIRGKIERIEEVSVDGSDVPPRNTKDRRRDSEDSFYDDDRRRNDDKRGVKDRQMREERRGNERSHKAEKDTRGRDDESYQDSYYEDDYFSGDDYDDRSYKSRDTDRYQGDVSTWGHKKDPDYYNKRSSESDFTMSSGLSPRDTRPRHRDFDLEAAKRSLAYNAGMYGKAQGLRRDGTSPAVMGVADDLPTRVAYEQLNALSGMASKVQAAIDHNKRVFEARMRMEDTNILKKAFSGWRAAKYGSSAKQQILRRAVARIQRGVLSRAFQAWKDRFHIVDQTLAMKRKLTAVVSRGRLKRCFTEWQRLVQDRWWKNQLSMRDDTIHALERKISGYELRPLVVLRKRRMSSVMYAWYLQAEERRRRRLRFEKAVKHFKNQNLLKAWNSWFDFHTTKQRHAALLTKTAQRIRNMNLASAFDKWYDLVLEAQDRQAKFNKSMRFWLNSSLAKAWKSWQEHVAWRKEKRGIMQRWKQPLLARAFAGWHENVAWRQRMKVIMQRAAGRLKNKALAAAFYTWKGAVDDEVMGRNMSTKDELAAKVKDLLEENERIRRDNERFVRLIDSGEWGRGRVAELVAAGEVLKGERDALVKLIQSMRREYEAVQHAKLNQEDEMKALKDRMMLGGAARNKMLVKGGSSFNALVRAMKQDLIEGGAGAGAAAKNPNVLYEVDKLSMDHVTVFPDGQLNVEAIASVPTTTALARPLSAGRAMRGPSTTLGPNMAPPLQPARLPQEFLRDGHGGALGPTPGGSYPGSPARPLSGSAGPYPGRPAGGSGRFQNAAARAISGSLNKSKEYQRVLDTLQSLTPAEVDKLEALVKQQAAAQQAAAAGAGLGGPSGARR